MDGFHGVATALKIVGDIQFQFDVARIGKTHDLVKLFGAFAERAHVVMVSERDSEISGALAELGESFAQLFEVRRGGGTTLGTIIKDLEVESAYVAQKVGVGRVLGNAVFRNRWGANQIAAGKRHELQFVPPKQIAHRGGPAKLGDAVGWPR